MYFSEYGLCNGLAILNQLSSQVSLTTLLIISFYRLLGVIRPFQEQHFKSALAMVILTWIIWFAVAVLPVIPLQTLQKIFTIGFARGFRYERDSFIAFQFFASVIQTKIIPSFSNFTEVTTVLKAVTQFPTPSVMENFLLH